MRATGKINAEKKNSLQIDLVESIARDQNSDFCETEEINKSCKTPNRKLKVDADDFIIKGGRSLEDQNEKNKNIHMTQFSSFTVSDLPELQ